MGSRGVLLSAIQISVSHTLSNLLIAIGSSMSFDSVLFFCLFIEKEVDSIFIAIPFVFVCVCLHLSVSFCCGCWDLITIFFECGG